MKLWEIYLFMHKKVPQIKILKDKLVEQRHSKDQKKTTLESGKSGNLNSFDDLSKSQYTAAFNSISSIQQSITLQNRDIKVYTKSVDSKHNGFKIVKVPFEPENQQNIGPKFAKMLDVVKRYKMSDSVIEQVSDYNDSLRGSKESKKIRQSGFSRMGTRQDSRRSSERNIKSKKTQVSTLAQPKGQFYDENVSISEFDMKASLKQPPKLQSHRKQSDHLETSRENGSLLIDSVIKNQSQSKQESNSSQKVSNLLFSIFNPKIQSDKNQQQTQQKNKIKHSRQKNKNKTLHLEKQISDNQNLINPNKQKLTHRTSLLQPLPKQGNQMIQNSARFNKSERSSPQNTHKIQMQIEKNAQNQLYRMVAEKCGFGKSDKETQIIKNRMLNQKNLKLKDYLRLTSLSKDAKFDKYDQTNPIRKSMSVQNSMIASRKSSQKKNPIDPERSIKLIKASLRKKLSAIIKQSFKIIQQIEQGNFVGYEYTDLVLICNFHRIFDENMFKSVGLLEELFQQYINKKHLKQNISMIVKNDHNQKTTSELEIAEVMSPTKKKKKQISLDEILKYVLGFNKKSIVNKNSVLSNKQ